MSWHEVWHVAVLGSTLIAAAAAAILVLAPVIFASYPEGLRRARPLVLALVALGVVLLAIEWLVVHGSD